MSDVTTKTPLTLICDIIEQGLGLPAGSAYLWNQNLTLPPDMGLYVAVSVQSQKVFSSSRAYLPDSTLGLIESQTANVQATLGIDIISRGPDARDRKEEVVMALNSTLSEQIQEANNFRIFPLPSQFVDLSQMDGSSIPYRFNISVNVQFMVTKTGPVPYYDTFQTSSIVTDP